MIWLFSDERMQEHVPGPQHPERPERLAAIRRHLDRAGIAQGCRTGVVREATDQELLRVHEAEHLEDLAAVEAMGGGHLDADTWAGPGSNRAARLAAGSAIEAVAAVLKGPERIAFAAVRPPGHHARPRRAMGFCLYGNVAVAAADALARHGISRVLIVDWDVHHGNGTQEMFYEDDRVGFLSIHRYPFYPGTGAADETGAGRGLGLTRNVPLPFGTPRKDYHAAFRGALEAMADKVRPELVLISAGFDAHAKDPVGNLGLEVEDYSELTREVLDVAKVHAQGRLVSVLEGGYNVPVLVQCVAAHLEALGAEPSLGVR